MNYFKIKNSLLLLIVVSIFVFSSQANAATSTTPVQIKSTVKDEPRTFTGHIINNHTYVDVIGLLVSYPIVVNSKALSYSGKTFRIYSADFASNQVPVFQFHVGDSYFLYNNQKINMDSKILIVNNRIQIPLKPVVALNNVKVEYDKSTNTVLVSK